MSYISYELECGHAQVAMNIGAILPVMVCATHKFSMRVTAIECREWHLKCQSHGTTRRCAFAGWFDQDHDAAIRKGDRHRENTGHTVQEIDYRVQPKKREHVKKFFSRAVKTVIVPKERSNKIEGATRNTPKPYAQTLPDIDFYTEGVPF